MPKLLGRREIGFLPAGVEKIKKLTANHVHMRGVSLFILVLPKVSYDWSVKNMDCSW